MPRCSDPRCKVGSLPLFGLFSCALCDGELHAVCGRRVQQDSQFGAVCGTCVKLVAQQNELLCQQGLAEMSIEYMVELQNASRAEEADPDYESRAEEAAPNYDGGRTSVTLEGQQVAVPQGNDGALVSLTNELLRQQGLPEMSIEYMVELQNASRAEEVAHDRDRFGTTAMLEGQQVARHQGNDEALVALTESAPQSRLSTINEDAEDMCEEELKQVQELFRNDELLFTNGRKPIHWCPNCGKLAGMQYTCQFCAIPMHLYCTLEQRDDGPNGLYTCLQCHQRRSRPKHKRKRRSMEVSDDLSTSPTSNSRRRRAELQQSMESTSQDTRGASIESISHEVIGSVVPPESQLPRQDRPTTTASAAEGAAENSHIVADQHITLGTRRRRAQGQQSMESTSQDTRGVSIKLISHEVSGSVEQPESHLTRQGRRTTTACAAEGTAENSHIVADQHITLGTRRHRAQGQQSMESTSQDT
jgi:hypothetical protein